MWYQITNKWFPWRKRNSLFEHNNDNISMTTTNDFRDGNVINWDYQTITQKLTLTILAELSQSIMDGLNTEDKSRNTCSMICQRPIWNFNNDFRDGNVN